MVFIKRPINNNLEYLRVEKIKVDLLAQTGEYRVVVTVSDSEPIVTSYPTKEQAEAEATRIMGIIGGKVVEI